MAGMPGLVIRFGADTKDALDGINRVEKALGRTLTPVEKLDRVSRNLGVAFAAAGAAAGAFALKLAVDGVNAALADQKAMAALQTTLENANQGWKTDSVESWIDATARASGVADDELRPALSAIVAVTQDTAEAQDLLTIAMNAAAGGTVSLESATTALAKAAGGNTTSLGKLFPALDKTRLSTEGLSYATDELSRIYAGQAAAAANTYQGKIDRLTVAAGEATEQIGYALLGALDDVSEAMGGTNGAADAADTLATEFSYLITGAGKVATGLAKVTKAAMDAVSGTDDQTDSTDALWGALSLLGGPLYSSIAGLRNFGRQATVTAAQTDMNTAAVNRLAYGYAALAKARIGAQTATAAAVSSTWNSGYVKQAEQANTLAKRLDETAKAAEDAAKSIGGGGGGGGSPSLKDAAKVSTKAFDDLAASVQDTFTALKSAQGEIDAAWAKMREGGQAYADWLSGGISLSEAMKTATASVGTEAAISYMDAFTAQIKASTDAAAAMKALADNLKAAGVDQQAGAALMAQLMTLPPGQAALVANDLVANGMGPELARQLSEYNLFAGQAGITFSAQFTDAGVDAAYAQYAAISSTLTSKLQDLYDLGKSMGKAVADGYKDATAGIPQASVSKGSGGNASTRSAAPNITVNVTGAIDPVSVARQIERVLSTGRLRGGRGV